MSDQEGWVRALHARSDAARARDRIEQLLWHRRILIALVLLLTFLLVQALR